jgi:hypothetical protein
LSREIITKSFEDISTGLFTQLRNKSKEPANICLEMDDSNEASDTALLLITISGTTESKQISEELLVLKAGTAQ